MARASCPCEGLAKVAITQGVLLTSLGSTTPSKRTTPQMTPIRHAQSSLIKEGFMHSFLLALLLTISLYPVQPSMALDLNSQQAPAGGSDTTASPEKGATGLWGTVTDTSGAVVVQATVAARSARGEVKTAVTDAEGKFQINGLAPGKYHFAVTAEGFADFQIPTLNVAARQRYVLLAIVLQPQPGAAGTPFQLGGTVTDTSGAVVTGATVTVRNAAGESNTAVTGAEGKFQITVLSPGKYEVTVVARGYADFRTAGLSARSEEGTVPIAIMLSAAPAPVTIPSAGQVPPAALAVAPAPSAEQAPSAAPTAGNITLGPPEEGATGLVGTVTDTSGAIVVGAKVIVQNIAGESKNTLTDAEGKFRVTGLANGKYDVSVTSDGFALFKSAVEVNTGELESLAVQLQLAITATQVNVEAQRAAQVETENAEISGTITQHEIVSFGLNGRNFTQLIALAPGVSSQTGQDEAKVGVQGSAKYSVNGGRVEYNTFSVDGSDVVNTDIAASHGHTTLLVYPSLDAIQDLKVLTSNYGAQYGRTASGTVLVTTKSGGQKLHGDAYEFLRNQIFNARNFFDPPGGAPLYHRQDFGVTLGGPLFIPNVYNTTKDKTYFFFSEELRLERSPYEFNQGVPSDAERGWDPANQSYDLIPESK